MPVRQAPSDDSEPRQWPARLRTRGARLARPTFEAQQHVLSPSAGTSDFVVVTGTRRGVETSDFDPASGCEDDDLSDALPADSADDSDSDTADAQVCKREPIQPNAFLRIGTVFEGHQRVCHPSSEASAAKEEQWDVSVTIEELDLAKGYCAGCMQLSSQAEHPILTHWTGELIDDVNNSFVTCKWGASYVIDMSHWRKFSSFGRLRKRVTRLHGRCYKLHENPFIFMRWKEMFFMGNKQVNSNLTIAGFYYICLCRSTGKIEGYYFDPSSMPYQKLELHSSSPVSYYAEPVFL